MKNFKISPSLICADEERMEEQITEIKRLGIEFLHTDIIDGKFSPDIPLTYERLDRITAKTDMPLDFHIMATDNEYHIKKALEYNASQICFHCEAEIHVDRMLNLIKANGVKCGLALAPATPLSVLDYVAEICDFVLLMLINPGYASAGTEKLVPYAFRKIEDCRRYLDERGLNIPIEVDGRVSADVIPSMAKAGAEIFVSGSTGVFAKGRSIRENYVLIENSLK